MKLAIIRRFKALFMRFNLHVLFEPFSGFWLNMLYLSKLSKWRKQTPCTGFNDFYLPKWTYDQRLKVYDYLVTKEQAGSQAVNYLEFGVCGGHSLKWWLENNQNPGSRFYGFDTFEGLPENWGHFKKGDMAAALDSLDISDTRCELVKGLFQDTIWGVLHRLDNSRRNIIHLDADLFSSTIFALSQLYSFLKDGDILIFDEFAVPKHEFLAFKIFTEAFYIKYELLAAGNNYLFVAVKIRK
jgi:O-methyltransferase